MTVISLLTDFGTQDGYPGVMKSVILNIAPNVQIVDLSHEIPAQDVLAGALLLSRSASYFPDGTIHVVVIDPGVGTSRRAIAAHVGTQYFVAPDNGLLSLVFERAEAEHQPVWIGELDRPAYWLAIVSNTFHGRDIFAPVAAHLANGIPIEQLSSRIDNPVRLELPQPIKTGYGWKGQVIHIDHFGNLSTNIDASLLKNINHLTMIIKDKRIDGLSNSFGAKAIGTLVAVIDSYGALAISIVNGNAAKLLSISIGDQVEVHIVR